MNHFRHLLFSLILIMACWPAKAQQKRALLIGINQYHPGEGNKASDKFMKRNISDLNGPVNDVASMESVLMTRYGFTASSIEKLLDEKATRQQIIARLENLAAISSKGDLVFIFFAGHGSQVYNSLSRETDKMDETIVPSDAWKEGTRDIRDKELAAFFNQILDKQVILTAVFDCCHSGSLERGAGLSISARRFAGEDKEDIRDPQQPISPENHVSGSFLFMSAAQDNELAEESIRNGIFRGAFTSALCMAIGQLPVAQEADQLFQATRSILKSENWSQEPALVVSSKRAHSSFLGYGETDLPERPLYPVTGLQGPYYFLQGGFAAGLSPNTRLRHVFGKDTAYLEVDSIMGPSVARAKRIRGNTSLIEPGVLFEIADWSAPGTPLINIYIPGIGSNQADWEEWKTIYWQGQLPGAQHPIIPIGDIVNAEYVILFDQSSFQLKSTSGSQSIKPDLKQLNKLMKTGSGYYMEFPVIHLLSDVLKKKLQTSPVINIVSSLREADYTVYGQPDADGSMVYGLRSVHMRQGTNAGIMPVITKGLTYKPGNEIFVAEGIYALALNLAKLKGWIQLAPPPNGERYFPYHLEMANKNTGLPSNGLAHIGETLTLKLMLNDKANAKKIRMPDMYYYIFTVTQNGRVILFHPNPRSEGFTCADETNRVTSAIAQSGEDIPVFNIPVTPPTGTDCIFLLASTNPIYNCKTLFNQAGSHEVVEKGTSNDPLSRLLNLGNDGYQPRDVFTSEKWTLLKFTLQTVQ